MTAEQPPAEGLTASQRIALALGRPMPRQLTEAEIREFEAAEDRADAEVERLYGGGADRSAA